MAKFKTSPRLLCTWLLVVLFSGTPVIIQAHATDHQDFSSDSICTICVFKSQLQMDDIAWPLVDNPFLASLNATNHKTNSPTLLPARARARSPPSH